MFDILNSDDSRLSIASNLHTRLRANPSPDTDLHQVGRRRVGDVRGVEEWGAVHSLIICSLAQVAMAIKVNYADVAVDVRGHAANIGISYRVVAAKHDGEDAAFSDIADSKGNLVKA